MEVLLELLLFSQGHRKSGQLRMRGGEMVSGSFEIEEKVRNSLLGQC